MRQEVSDPPIGATLLGNITRDGPREHSHLHRLHDGDLFLRMKFLMFNEFIDAIVYTFNSILQSIWKVIRI